MCIVNFLNSIHGTDPYTFRNEDIASVKPARYMGRPVAAGATGASGSRMAQNEDMATLLEDIHRRCEGLLTGVSERGWQDLDNQYIELCIGLPSEWRGIMRRMAMAGQTVCDLQATRAEPLARDPPESDYM